MPKSDITKKDEKPLALAPGSDILQGWGENIVEALHEARMNQATLAALCGVHDSTIHRLIKGEFDPRIELKLKIAAALGVRVDRLWQWPAMIPQMPAA